MDCPEVDSEQLRKSLRFIRQINWLLGYTRITVAYLERFSRNWKQGQIIRIIDVASGSADIPRAVLRWADRRGQEVRITALDLHARTIAEARRESPDRRLSIVRADALDLPFRDGSFDYAMTNMFLHHLDDDQIVTVLKNMARVARRGIIVADLIRNRRAYAWITLLTLLANPMVKHDGRASVAQALTHEEVLALRDRAGIDFAVWRRHFGHRFVLAGEREKM